MATTPHDDPAEAALAWFVRLRDEQASTADRAAFDVWLRESPEHARQWLELEALWGELDTVKPQPVEARTGSPRRLRGGGLALAASLLLALGLSAAMLFDQRDADHRTGAGERRVVTLADGSRIDLAPSSALDVDFTPERRRITLLSGQAFFTVARDPARPFAVTAHDGTITALGTAFDVRMGLGDAVSVGVAESRVAVATGAPAVVVVAEGQGVDLRDGAVSPPEPRDAGEIGAWRSGRLVFHEAPLAEVVADLSRYRVGRIAVLSGSASRSKVTAALDSRDLDAGLNALAESLGLRVLRPLPWITLLIPG